MLPVDTAQAAFVLEVYVSSAVEASAFDQCQLQQPAKAQELPIKYISHLCSCDIKNMPFYTVHSNMQEFGL